MSLHPEDARFTAPLPIRNGSNLDSAWLVVGSVLAVLSLAMATLQVLGVIAHEERTQTVTIADPVVSVLDVASDNGRVEVVGADIAVVRITARVSDGLVATAFRHEVVGNRLEVRVRCHKLVGGAWCGAGLRILVPKQLEVRVRADDDRVVLRGISGRVDAESNNDTVEAEALSGQTRLHSDNGSVRATGMLTDSLQADSNNDDVRVEFDRAPQSAVAHSDNGSVEILLPRSAQGYDVDVSSDHGSTDNLVTTDSNSDRRIVATSNNGSVTVRYVT